MLRLSVAAYVFAEVASLVVAGRLLGVGVTLLLVGLAVALGAVLLRRQGNEALASLRRSLDGGRRDPRPALVRGGFRFVAALLLILPGFVGDVAALLLLLPAVQRATARRLAGRGVVIVERDPRSPRQSEPVLDAEWEELPPPRPTHPSSGSTRH